jgi:hypothetical protein
MSRLHEGKTFGTVDAAMAHDLGMRVRYSSGALRMLARPWGRPDCLSRGERKLELLAQRASFEP